MGSINVLFSDEVQSKFKTWTSQAGTKIQARLINADHSEVNLKTNKGKVIRLHPDKLCEADRDMCSQSFQCLSWRIVLSVNV